MFGAIANRADVVLELAARRIEGVAGRDIGILVRRIEGMVTAGNQLRAGYAQIDPNREEVALVPVTVSAFDHHPARGDAVEALLELGRLAANLRFERRRGIHVAEGDLERQCHRMPPAVNVAL